MMNARPAPTSRPVNTAMNAPMAEPRRSSPFAATAAIAGVAAPNPVSSAPATARIMPTERMARTRSRARNIAKPSNATPMIPIGIQSQIHCLTVNRVSTAEFCDTVADASSTLAGSFFERDGLIVSQRGADGGRGLLRVDVDAAVHPGLEHLVVGPHRELANRILDRRGGDCRGQRVGDERPGAGDEVGRPGEPQRRLVGEVVAHLLLLRRLRDHVREPGVVEHPGVEPPSEGRERDEQAARERHPPDAPAPERPPGRRRPRLHRREVWHPFRSRRVAVGAGLPIPDPERRREATFSTCEHRLDGLRSRCSSCSRSPPATRPSVRSPGSRSRATACRTSGGAA